MPERYAVRITTCARHQFNLLSHDLRERALRELIRLTELAATMTPPTRQMLEGAQFDPPVLRAVAWPLVLVYESDPERRALTVLHVLCAGEPRPGAYPEPERLAAAV